MTVVVFVPYSTYIIHKYFLNIDISLNSKGRHLKFEICLHDIYTQRSMSQILYLGPSFYYIESRIISLKKRRSFPFFVHKKRN